MISAWGVNHGEVVDKRMREVGGIVYNTTRKLGYSTEHAIKPGKSKARKIPALKSRTTAWDKKTGEFAGEHKAERNLRNPLSTQVNLANTESKYQRAGQATEALRQQSSALGGARRVRHSTTISEDGKKFAASAPKRVPKRSQKQTRVNAASRKNIKGQEKSRDTKIKNYFAEGQASAEATSRKMGITPDMTTQQRVQRAMEYQRSKPGL